MSSSEPIIRGGGVILPRRGTSPPAFGATRQASRTIVDASYGHDAVDQRDGRYKRALAVADLLAIAVTMGVLIADTGAKAQLVTLLAFPLVVLAAKIAGLYDRDELLLRKTTIDEAPQIFHLATFGVLALWLADGTLFDTTLTGGQVAVMWAILFFGSLFGRRTARALTRRFVTPERCLFIGDASSYDRLRSKMAAAGVHGDLVGRMTLERTGCKGMRPHPEKDELLELLAWTGAQRAVIEPSALPDEEMLALVRTAKAAGVRVSLLPRILDVVGSEVVFDDLQGMTLLGVRRFGLTRSSVFIKRSFDTAGAAIMLLAAAPVMAVIALLIKLSSRGPVFFRQSRIGRDGEVFRIIKFRTMVPDAEARKSALREHNEADGLFKIADDPRVTRIGSLLRRTSLDELPQLFNVLMGDMSLVGPRPLVADEDEQIKGLDRGRLQLTPGMTGQWQIAGSARVPLHEMVKIDYLYVAGWSLWADIKILARTIPYMLSRRGL